MDAVITIFAIMGALIAGFQACEASLKGHKGEPGCLVLIKFIFCLVVLFGGPVVTADRAAWSHGLGGGLVCIALGTMSFRVIRQHRHKKAIIPDLPIPVLWRVFDARLVGGQKLSFEAFKAEYKSTNERLGAGGIGETAALLLFVDPLELSVPRVVRRVLYRSEGVYKRQRHGLGKRGTLPLET
ncbi:hypothetical protein PSACC_00201 [Paramicrosporidium saccamoebae]|uniref:Uncharacterized protein n=1 Tax=Paramicrosporidium saccamoebae TaxID=1246581 RepID=A0A2H9TQG0_9FUNG|nr:hypothetical protein PSACC_00201 [Paramicrosporidium saccamoebae]